MVQHDSSFEIVGVFGSTLDAVWSHAVTTLGSVTLTAIAERVLRTATGRYPFLSVINTRPNGDARWRHEAHERLAAVPRTELLEGVCVTLLELLTVIGRLTAEILSRELHAAVLAVAANTTATPDAKLPAGLHALRSLAAGKAQP